MAPTCFPKVVPVQVDKKWILVIIARTGQQRPYKVPEYVTSRKGKKVVGRIVGIRVYSKCGAHDVL